ncbi:MAG: D-sedoheptulose 7-phosphate isomerase [Bacteroidaceae bacterium]|nr:D-sedoheptulose 7-phosphate isomerase [Bacteroidaceae bacterium]
MQFMKSIKEEIAQSIAVKQSILENEVLLAQIAQAAEILTRAYRDSHSALLAGNGGSAADAQHLAGELVNKFYFDRPGIPAHSLSTDTSVMTAIGNDIGFKYMFARQIQAQGSKGDVFIGISTSGNSENIVEALKVCREKGITSIGLTGSRECLMDGLCDLCIKVPSDCTPRIQESHILIGHIVCAIVEENLFGKK